MKIRFCLLILLTVFIKTASAQSKEYWFAFKISSVTKKSTNQFLISIDRGSELGLKPGDAGEVWVIPQQGRTGDSHFIKKITLQEVKEKHATGLVETKDPLYVGDELFVKIPTKRAVRTSYFYLMSYDILFLDESGKPYYTFEEIYEKDGYALRTEKFLAMQQAIREQGKKLVEKGNTERIQAGKHKDKLLSEILVATDTLDVWNFLYHTSLAYKQTLGKSFSFVKEFSAYILEGDRATATELKKLLIGVNPTILEEHYTQYKRKITASQIKTWVNEAKELREAEKYVQAEEILAVCIYLSEKLKDPYNVGLYSYELAVVFDNQDKYDRASEWLIYSSKQFKEANGFFGQGYAEHYLAFLYEKNNQHELAMEHYKNALNLRQQLFKEDPSDESNQSTLHSTLTAIANLAKKQEDFELSKEYFLKALDHAKLTKNKKREATVLWDLGNLYEGMKLYAPAINSSEQAFQIYVELNDSSNQVEMKRNEAIFYNKMRKFPQAKESIGAAVQVARGWNKPEKIAYTLDYQGLLCFEYKQYDCSIESYLESERIYVSLRDTAQLIKAKKNLSKSYRDAKNVNQAIRKQQEITALIKPGDLSAKADALWEVALLHGNDYAKNPKKAISYYNEAITIYSRLKDTTNLATVYNNIGYQYRDLGDSVNAYKSHQKAIALTTKRLAGQADSYERLGFSYQHFKNWKKSLQSHHEALRLYKIEGDFIKSGKATENIASVYKETKDFENVGKYYKESIELYRQAGARSDEAESYWDYAFNLGNLRQYDEAIKNYRIAYGIYMEELDSVNASVMLSNVGQDYWNKLDYESAIKSHQAAIELAKLCNNQKQVASSWSKLASLYTESNNPVAATQALNNTVDALTTLNDSTLLSSAYNDLAESYLKSKDYVNSLEYYNRAISIRKALHDSTNWALSVYGLAGVYQNKTEYKKSESQYQQSLQLYRKLKDKLNAAYSLANLGVLAQNADSDYKKANTYFQEAIKLSIELKDDNLLAYSYLRMKGLNRAQGNMKAADDYITKALALYKKIKQAKDIAYTLAEIGNDAAYVKGDHEKAIQYFDQAQVIADTLADLSLKAYLIGLRGNVAAEMGDFQKALSLCQESLDLYNKTDNEWGLAGVYIDMGNVYKQLSEYDKSLHYQQKSDSLYKKVNSEYSRLAPLANIGAVYTAQGDYKKGLEYYEKSLAIMTKAGDFNENVGIIQASIGESYYYLNDYAQSDKRMKESLGTFNKVGAIRPKMEALNIIGRLKIDEEKFDEAANYLKEGIQGSKEKSLKVTYVTGIGLLGQLEVRRKNYPVAKPLLEEGVKTSREMGKYNTLWESLYWLGMLHKENNQLAESRKYLEESASVIEKIRNKVSGGEEAQKLFSSDKNILKVYEALVDVLLQLGETDAAMSYLQKNNEDNLKAKFKGLDVKFENEDKNKVLIKERSMKAKLDGIEQQIANEKAFASEKQNLEKLKNLESTKTIAEGDYLKFVNQQVNVRPELTKYFNNSIQPAQLKGKKKQIPKDMALLSYLAGENQLYIFVATSDTVIAKVVNVTRAQLVRNINASLNMVKLSQGTFDKINLKSEEAERRESVLAVSQTDPVLKPFEDLYHFLIAPVISEIVDKKRLCIIPSGSLSYIPFQLLGKTMKSGKFSLLINQYSIFYANSTDMLLRHMGTEAREFNILAFGNPDKTLPSTEKEVNDLKKLFPNTSVFVQDEATEDRAKYAGEEYNIIHFATHGNLDYEDFGKSFLTMASNPAKGEDGLLTLEELWGMDVMSHLNIVVLSACQTAVSKGSDESSPVSPASGFLQNGVKSVVATLWKVDDEATALLMGDFYKNIKTMDAVDALRQAQVSLSNNPKYSHPFYWAAAVLLGDWR
jgi:CHAT domain-containing protein